MKLITFISIIACATIAIAQTSTSEKATGSTDATAKPAAGTTPVMLVAAADKEQQAASGTSTADATAAAASAKKWNLSLVFDALTSNEGMKDIGNASVESVNYFGGGYKITDNEKIGFRQYFNYNSEPNKTTDPKTSFSVLTFGTKWNGIAGSDKISPLFWYYMPGSTAEKTNYGADFDFQGQFRMDAEIVWHLNPKWDISWYLNPRQSLGPQQTFVNENTGKDYTFEATTRLIQYGIIYYNFTDSVQAYFYGGMDKQSSYI